MVEQWTENSCVAGSSPAYGTKQMESNAAGMVLRLRLIVLIGINKCRGINMYTCKHCKMVEYEKLLSLRNHERCCKNNPLRIIPPIDAARKLRGGNSDATKKLLSIIAKENKLGGYIQGSGRGKKGWYKGFFCDSSWELAYVIYCLEHNVDIKRNTEKRQYVWQGAIKNYIPDFIVHGSLIEVKGFKPEQWLAKLEANPDVSVLYEKELKPILEYVTLKYGKDFISLYE